MAIVTRRSPGRIWSYVATLAVACAAAAGVPAAAQDADPRLSAVERSIRATKDAMLGDPKEALVVARRTVALADALPPSRAARVARATALWLEGEALIGLNRSAAAQPVVTAALEEAGRYASGTKLNGDLLRSHGALAAGEGRVLDALKDYQHAYRVFRQAGIRRSQAIALQDMGDLYFEAKDYEKVVYYYNEASETWQQDPLLALAIANNLGEVYRSQGKFGEAAAQYRKALRSARAIRSALLENRILTNLATAELDGGNVAAARQAVARAMEISARGEAAEWRRLTLSVAARLALESGDLGRATLLVGQAFAGQDLTRTTMVSRDDHNTAARIYEKTGDAARALQHVRAVQRLDAEAQRLTASMASQLMGARFDFTNQNLKISKLKQQQLQKNFEMERQRSRFRTYLLGGLLAAGGLILALVVLSLLSLRRSRNQVRDANRDLTCANRDLEKALKAKTEFLATTSHEIRTPLNGILGMTQVILADQRLAAEMRDRVTVIHGAGETMRALVDDILDIAKMENGELTVASEPVDLAAILTDAAQLWSGHAERKGLAMRVDIPDLPDRIRSDGARIRQIVFNLMSNAVKFTATGHVMLAARVEHDPQREAEALVLSVADTGLGIPAEKQDEIFEAFRQIDGSTTRQFAGTGLGLAICKRLAEALGGTIRVDSRVGRGSTFTVALPLHRCEQDRLSQAGASEPSPLAAVTMMLVEPSIPQAELLRAILAPQVDRLIVVSDPAAADGPLASGVDHLVIGSRAGRGEDLAMLVEQAGSMNCRTTLLVEEDRTANLIDFMAIGASQLIVEPIAPADLLDALASVHGDEPQSLVAPALLSARAA